MAKYEYTATAIIDVFYVVEAKDRNAALEAGFKELYSQYATNDIQYEDVQLIEGDDNE